MLDASLYEFPLNERMRNFMRLENCFAQVLHFSARNSIWESQASLLILMEILNIMERHDIRGEVSKELERNIVILNNLLNVPGINSNRLQQTLDDLHSQLYVMQNIHGRGAKALREDDLLNTIRQRTSLTANINSFEIPSYYYWLNQSLQVRQLQINQWLEEITPIATAISLLLDLIRSSATFDTRVAEAGFFQQALGTQQICQMLRIELPTHANFFPEASGSKHRITVRFLTYSSTKQRPTQVTDNIDFNICCCAI